jgi:hypothetical protein
VGLVYGVIVWVLFFLPLLMYSFLPNLAAMTAMDTKMDVGMVTMDMLSSVGGLAMGLTLASHLIYGAIIGLIVGGLTQWKKTLG